MKMTKRHLAIFVCLVFVVFMAVNWLLAPWFKEGLRRYYCLTPSEVLVIGHSMSEMGIDRNLLAKKLGMTVSKYCMNGAGTADRLVMIQHYLEATGHKPKYVLYDVSGRSFSYGLANNSFSLFYPFMEESPTANRYVKENAPAQEYWRKKLFPLCRYDDTRLGAVVRGWRGDWKNRTLKQFDADNFRLKLSLGEFWHISLDKQNMAKFVETLEYLEKENIGVILLALPCVDLLNTAEPELYAQVWEFLRQQTAKFPNVHFLDFNPEFSHQYELFGDPIHLNPKGQQIVTRVVGEKLTELFKEP